MDIHWTCPELAELFAQAIIEPECDDPTRMPLTFVARPANNLHAVEVSPLKDNQTTGSTAAPR
jgi:hypothetical protein